MLPCQFITRTSAQNQVTTSRVSRGTKTTAQVPAGFTGNIVEVLVSMFVNGSLRTGSYSTILFP